MAPLQRIHSLDLSSQPAYREIKRQLFLRVPPPPFLTLCGIEQVVKNLGPKEDQGENCGRCVVTELPGSFDVLDFVRGDFQGGSPAREIIAQPHLFSKPAVTEIAGLACDPAEYELVPSRFVIPLEHYK
jgi:hypothetical protein